VFKLGIGKDLGISYTSDIGLKGQRSTLGLELTAIRRGFAFYECLLLLDDQLLQCIIGNEDYKTILAAVVTSTVEDLPDCSGRQEVIATKKVGDVAADWYNDCHNEMRQR